MTTVRKISPTTYKLLLWRSAPCKIHVTRILRSAIVTSYNKLQFSLKRNNKRDYRVVIYSCTVYIFAFSRSPVSRDCLFTSRKLTKTAEFMSVWNKKKINHCSERAKRRRNQSGTPGTHMLQLYRVVNHGSLVALGSRRTNELHAVRRLYARILWSYRDRRLINDIFIMTSRHNENHRNGDGEERTTWNKRRPVFKRATSLAVTVDTQL